jgi:hypothetical protein
MRGEQDDPHTTWGFDDDEKTAIEAWAYQDGPRVVVLGEPIEMSWDEWDEVVAWLAEARASLTPGR